MRALAAFAMAARWRAALLLVATAATAVLLPPVTTLLAYLGAAVVGLVTLRRGAGDGALVIGLALLACFLLAAAMPAYPLRAIAVSLLLWLWLPQVLVALVLRHGRSLDLAFQVTALLGGLVVVLIHLAVGDPQHWWLERLQPLADMLRRHGSPLSEAQLARLAASMTGVVAAGFSLGTLGALLLARWWQSLLYYPGGFGQAFRRLRLGRALAVVTLACLLVTGLARGRSPGALAGELLAVLLGLWFFQGLAVVHGVARQRGLAGRWLLPLYLALVLLYPLAEMVLALGGWLDSWIDIRRRAGAADGGERHS